MTNPVLPLLDTLTRRIEQRHAWLLRAGPIARRLNEQSLNDAKEGSEQ